MSVEIPDSVDKVFLAVSTFDTRTDGSFSDSDSATFHVYHVVDLDPPRKGSKFFVRGADGAYGVVTIESQTSPTTDAE